MNNEIQVTKKQAPLVQQQESGASSLVQVISRAASDHSVDIVKLEKLLEMHERITARDAEVQFNSAMADMQAKIPSIAERGFGHNIKYATLEDILDVVRPIMHSYGFAVSFEVNNTDTQMIVTGVLMHRAGHSMRTSMTLPADKSGSKNAVQAIGSSTSYGKRYVLSAMLNIATRSEDDNGFAAVPFAPITAMQAQQISSLLEKCKKETQERFVERFGDPKDTPKSEFNERLAQVRAAHARDNAGEDNGNN